MSKEQKYIAGDPWSDCPRCGFTYRSSSLATKGFSQSWINANTSITKTRQEIVDDLRAALKNP